MKRQLQIKFHSSIFSVQRPLNSFEFIYKLPSTKRRAYQIKFLISAQREVVMILPPTPTENIKKSWNDANLRPLQIKINAEIPQALQESLLLTSQ